MKKPIFIILMVLLLLEISLFSEGDSNIWATYSDQKITDSDIIAYFIFDKPPYIIKQDLNRQLEKLKKDKEYEPAFTNLIKTIASNDVIFNLLKKEGYQAPLEIDINLFNKFCYFITVALKEIWGSEIKITSEEITNYYDTHKDEFKIPESATVRYLFLSKDTEKNELDRLIQSVKKELSDNVEFEKIVRKYSQSPNAKEGGVIGPFKRGELGPNFEKAAFAVEEGKISDIVETNSGFFWIQMLKKEPESIEELKNVSEKIKLNILNSKIAVVMKQKIEDWEKKNKIEIWTEKVLNSVCNPDDYVIKSKTIKITAKFFNQLFNKIKTENLNEIDDFIKYLKDKIILIEIAEEEKVKNEYLTFLFKGKDLVFQDEVVKDWFRNVKFKELPQPSQESIEQFYKKNKDHYKLLERYDTIKTNVKFTYRKEDKEVEKYKNQYETECLANELIKKIKKYKDFEKFLESENPFLLKYTNISFEDKEVFVEDNSSELPKVFKGMKVNEITEPKTTYSGVHFYILRGILPQKQLSFDESKYQIERVLQSDIFESNTKKFRDEVLEKSNFELIMNR